MDTWEERKTRWKLRWTTAVLGVSGLGFSVPSFLRIQKLMLPLVNIDCAKRIGGGKRCPCFSKRRKKPMPIGARAVTSMDIPLRLGLIRLCGMT